jgi:hypothetical protein
MNIVAELRQRGWPPELIATATVNGKPLAEIMVKAKPLDRYKSKLERLYAMELADLVRNGTVARWYYEPVTLRLADRTTYRPDFLLVFPDGTLQFVEIKGKSTSGRYNAGKAKFKIAREMYPHWQFVMLTRGKGGWEEIKI